MNRFLKEYYEQAPKDKVTPGDYYDLLWNWMIENGIGRNRGQTICYVTTAMTSGAFIGLLGNYQEEFEKNCDLGEMMLHHLSETGQLVTDLVIYPPDIGKISGWGQKEFNTFWFLMMAGVSGSDAKTITSTVVPPERMADTTLTKEQRWDLYSQYGKSLTEFARQANMTTRPPSEQILLIDPTSLGSRLEQQNARYYGVPVRRLRMGRLAPNDNIKEDLGILEKAGIVIPQIDKDVTFSLVAEQ